MGVLDTNRSQIVNGGLISASFVSDLYDVLTGNSLQDVSITGSLTITGSLIGNLTGTAETASYAETSSYYSGDNITSTSASFNYLHISDALIVSGTILLYTASLPTTDPDTVGQLWRSGSYLMISTGSVN